MKGGHKVLSHDYTSHCGYWSWTINYLCSASSYVHWREGQSLIWFSSLLLTSDFWLLLTDQLNRQTCRSDGRKLGTQLSGHLIALPHNYWTLQITFLCKNIQLFLSLTRQVLICCMTLFLAYKIPEISFLTWLELVREASVWEERRENWYEC